MNSITLTGYVGKDSELKEFNGTSLLKFSLGVEPNYKKNDEDDDTRWFNCDLWGKYGEAMAKHIKKGTKVLVQGEMILKWDKDKKKLYANVNVSTLEMIKWANDGDEMKNEPSEINPDDFASVEDDDDIPF